jgi:hypothetical protein
MGEMFRLPHCLDSRLMYGGEVISLTRQPLSTPQKYNFAPSDALETE